jgi:uncharacterized protein YbbK (DUF523 family)
MEKLIISACLLGKNCKYNGKNNYKDEIELLKDKFEIIPICPEVFGGLGIPRLKSEINNGKVINEEGIDVTRNFVLGANKALELAKDSKYALLKDGSPSCGSTYIYDGTFNSIKINDFGMTVRLLKEKNIKIYTENNWKELLK